MYKSLTFWFYLFEKNYFTFIEILNYLGSEIQFNICFFSSFSFYFTFVRGHDANQDSSLSLQTQQQSKITRMNDEINIQEIYKSK